MLDGASPMSEESEQREQERLGIFALDFIVVLLN